MKNKVLVVHSGSTFTRAGFTDEALPQIILPTLTGRRRGGMDALGNLPQHYVGYEALHRRGVRKLFFPISRGVVTDFGVLERVWRQAFMNDLKAEPTDCALVVSLQPLSTKAEEELVKALVLQRLGFKHLYMNHCAVLSLFSAGRVTGLVLHVGASLATATPVCEGFIIPNALSSSEIAGKAVDRELCSLLHARGYQFQTFAEREIVRDIKEKLSFVRVEEGREGGDLEYELPDGQIITLGSEMFLCNEILFNSHLDGEPALPSLVEESLRCLPSSSRKLMREGFVSGGVQKTKGFCERLKKECTSDLLSVLHLILLFPYSQWVGGKVVSCTPNFLDLCVS